jgi:hypothetical protein
MHKLGRVPVDSNPRAYQEKGEAQTDVECTPHVHRIIDTRALVEKTKV